METVMKRFSVLAISMLIIFALSSCEVHLGTQSYDVPWWFNALTVLVVCVPICVVAGFRISKNK